MLTRVEPIVTVQHRETCNQTYYCTLIAHQKLGQYGLLYGKKVGVSRHVAASWAS